MFFVYHGLWICSPIDTEQGNRIAERARQQYVNELLRLANYKVRQPEKERKWTARRGKKVERNRSATKAIC